MNIHIIGPEESCADDGYEVWLNPDELQFQGLCIGAGETKEDAMTDAIQELYSRMRHLSELLWQSRHAA